MQASWWTDLAQLDDEQREVISLGTGGDHLVIGPPGCGKTNLLLLRASYLHQKGMTNIKVLTFGRVLREFIASGTEHYTFAPDKVQTYIRWGYEVLAANGVEFEEGTDFDDTRARMFAALSAIAEQGKAENLYDVILLDEAQDYTGDEARLISSFGERVFAVGDDNQRITKSTGALGALAGMPGLTTTKLSHHYRNGLKICRVADGIKNLIDDPAGLEASCNYDEAANPSKVEVIGGIGVSEQTAQAVVRLKTQLQVFPDELIGLLCPRGEDVAAVKQVLMASDLWPLVNVQQAGGYSEFTPGQPIVLTTVQGAKGLEFRAVHILAADKLKNFPTQKNLTYTAATRAKTSLAVYHEANLAGYFEKGLNACETKKPAEPKLQDLFR